MLHLFCAPCVTATPPPPILPLYYNGYANSVMLMVVIVFRCVCVCILCHVPLCTIHTIHIMVPACTPPRPVRVCVCVYVYVCALPALLLNNPAYHLLLSDHRKSSRPLVVSSPTQAQEKSLNVPQGKRPRTGPAQSGGGPTSLPAYLPTFLSRAGAFEVLSPSPHK